MLPGNLGDFATGGGMLNPLTGEFNPAGAAGADKFGNSPQNSNPYGFTAPTGPSTQALVPYYNKATGETWNAPSGGYTPPSADWFQGSPGNSQIMPMPGFAPGLDPVKSNTSAGMAPSFLPQAEQDRLNALNLQNMNPQLRAPVSSQQPDPGPFAPAGPAPTNNIIKETLVPDGKGGYYDTASPRVPTGGNQNVGILSPAIGQQPRPTTGGLGSLATQQQPVVNRPVTPPVNAGGLTSLVRPQTPVNARPFVRNQIAPRAGSLPSLRFNPTNMSLPVPFTRPAFRR